MSADEKLCVFDIGFTYGIDGPGQRMVVYTKGCNMRCPWCASPESMSPVPQPLLYPERGPDPASIEAACPRGAVRATGEGVSRDTSLCRDCRTLDCVSAGVPAFELCGYELTVGDVIRKAQEYRPFYGRSGGVTIGGGEPTLRFGALKTILYALRSDSIGTAIETNGTHPRLPELYPAIDTLMIDLKHPSPGRCAEITGLPNDVTLANIRARAEHGGPMTVRIPLVPGYNADEPTLREFGQTLGAIGPLRVEVLPFHRRGEVKWQALGLQMPASAPEPSDELVARANDILKAEGLRTV